MKSEPFASMHAPIYNGLAKPTIEKNPLYQTHKDKIANLNSMGVDPNYRG